MNDIYVAIMLIFATAAVSSFATYHSVKDAYQEQAIEHACAAYDPQTGEWAWKEESEK